MTQREFDEKQTREKLEKARQAEQRNKQTESRHNAIGKAARGDKRYGAQPFIGNRD